MAVEVQKTGSVPAKNLVLKAFFGARDEESADMEEVFQSIRDHLILADAKGKGIELHLYEVRGD